MKKNKWIPSIIIWKLELTDNGVSFQSIYFLTKKGIKRFLKNHEEEIKERNLGWNYGGQQLWFW